MATAKGTDQLNVGIDKALMARLRAFADRRGEKMRAVVEAALVRHMDNPPPPPVAPPPPVYPPLPPVTSPGPGAVKPAKKPAAKGKKGK